MDNISLDILILEDDELQRKSMYDMLNGWGHKAVGCESLADARKLLEEGSYDLMFVDMMLPDGNGLELIAESQSSSMCSRMVLITAFADIKTAVDAIRLGAYDYLPKPFDEAQLKKIVRNISDKIKLGNSVASLTKLMLAGNEDVWQLDNMIGTEALKKIFDVARKVATTSDSTVLILGESGTGKGMLAKAMHRLSKRSDKPFIDINCSAIPAQLIESEIFGYEKGAFTDAKNKKPGLLELADGGTVFLDEIGDMELNLQSKLLKVIEDREFRRLGGARLTSVDVRILAATSRDLKDLASKGKFREDLYYRLSVVPITMPPLREHISSVMPLGEFYLKKFSREMGRDITGFSKNAIGAMLAYSWPGNVRELKNVIERSVILASGTEIDVDELGICDVRARKVSEVPEAAHNSAADMQIRPMSLAECEKKLIKSVLDSVDGNKNKAADVLQIHRTTLYKKIEEYNLLP